MRKNRGKTGRHKKQAALPGERCATGKCPCLPGGKSELIFFSFLPAEREIKIPKPLFGRRKKQKTSHADSDNRATTLAAGIGSHVGGS
ncbi:hypothetical protein KVG96_10135 [Pseudomonas sp. COR58]|uniref:Uncharacterized protein n=1 Tax=Pseudomonas ekonensis TaxID=2842353 RepID=A0ABS6PCW5_9PSED|nr:hypothetical protein [Pseudomonas ekonensis]MBV4458309.1 hypothetical protein [Pseudomonas ekonensis]